MKSGAVVLNMIKPYLYGIIATHVNDFCFEGLEIFLTRVMDRLRWLSKIKSEEVAKFQYIGLNIKKNRDNVKLGENEYKKNPNVSQLKEVEISATEVTETRQFIGQLNWGATQPDLILVMTLVSKVQCKSRKRLNA